MGKASNFVSTDATKRRKETKIVTKETKIQHMAKVQDILNVLEVAILLMKTKKCNFAQSQIERLGVKFTNSGVTPFIDEVQSISERMRPTNSKELRSYPGAVNQLNKCNLGLPAECFPFGNTLKKNAEWKWSQDNEKAYQKINTQVREAVVLTHFKRKCPLTIICDESKEGLGAVRKQ